MNVLRAVTAALFIHLLLIAVLASRLANNDASRVTRVGKVNRLSLFVNADDCASTQAAVEASLLLHLGLDLQEALDESLADHLVLLLLFFLALRQTRLGGSLVRVIRFLLVSSGLKARGKLFGLLESVDASAIYLILLANVLLDELRNEVAVRAVAVCHSAEPIVLVRRV